MAEKKLKLRTDPSNARTHPPRNLEAVKRSLDELGRAVAKELRLYSLVDKLERRLRGRRIG